ncbi:hypothetical protein [Kosakonia sacchari]|uniref:hypothetical protein n=1 Tax=Kosakonia sacchari TaxID=1158459 RepID=UPI0020B11EB4|nr:hypothetical protein [Kosakonia sacchari]
MNLPFTRVLSQLLAACLLFVSFALSAATMHITAEFVPSLENPEKNTFTNTTSQSGYCSILPGECAGTGMVSISMGGITASLATAGFTANSDPRMGMYFKMPGAMRNITVVNQQTGSSVTLGFRVNAFSARYHTRADWPVSQHQSTWNGSSFVYAPAPCGYSGVGWISYTAYLFMWKWPASDSACYKTARINLTDEPYYIDLTSLGYELVTPDPLKMASGTYTGTLSLSVGSGGDIDFGDNFKTSDNQLDLNFTLSVNHELKLTPAAGAQTVALQPCPSGKICSDDEGKANWERWMVSRVTPQLTGRSAFTLSSSGGFTVFLDCADQIGKECALTSDNSGQQVPMKVTINMPDNVVDMQTGSTVSGRPLFIGKTANQNEFTAKVYGADKPGSIDFLVRQKDVDTMLSTRPDTYRAAVSVIFDPNIF